MHRIVALVPMRHYTQRLAGKNYRSLAGKPLLHHIIATLVSVPEISEVVVNTDSGEDIRGFHKHFPQMRIIERTELLRADDLLINKILTYDIDQIDADFYVQTHNTNPLLHAITISWAIYVFLARYPAYESLFSVTRFQTRLWDQLGRAVNYNPAIFLQTQDLPTI